MHPIAGVLRMGRRALSLFVVGLLAIQAGLLTHSAKTNSPTFDEVGHLAAGLSHWELGRYELYSVNPPLVRTIAAAPVALWSKPEVDWGHYRDDPSKRTEIFVGRRLIELNGEDSFNHFFYARLAVIPIALLGGLLCFLWAKDLFESTAGLIALTLWTFSPNVLAYGAVITPDMGSTVALLGTSYLFWRWLKEPSLGWALSLSAALGLAMLTKSVWLGLPFAFAAIWLGARVVDRRSKTDEGEQAGEGEVRSAWISGRRGEALQLVAVTTLALVFVNGFYGFEKTFSRLGQFSFVSTSFSGNAAELVGSYSDCIGCPENDRFNVERGNRFAGSLLGSVPVPLPANYLQGIDIQVHDFERGAYDSAWKSYLLGQWKQGGWWYYYIVGLFFKVPIVIWLMLGAGSIAALSWRPERQKLLGVICLWGPAIGLFVVASACTGLNRYVRYVLPVLPVLLIWASQVGRWVESTNESFQKKAHIAIAVGCVWLAATSLWNAPSHLGYFNMAAGGPSQGHEVLCDSNIDWGQDLIRLKQWADDNPSESSELSLAYFGGFDPATVGLQYKLPPRYFGDSDSQQPAFRMSPGTYAVSKSLIAGHSMPVPDGYNPMRFRLFGPGVFSYFGELEPAGRIGHSINLYKVSKEQADKLAVDLNQRTLEMRKLARQRREAQQPTVAKARPAQVNVAKDEQQSVVVTESES